jgi:hypothetical protein
MPCRESMELENIWQRRYERAEYVEHGGLFAVPFTISSHILTVRQHRARQAQAANAILMHRKTCHLCSSDAQEQADGLFKDLAS